MIEFPGVTMVGAFNKLRVIHLANQVPPEGQLVRFVSLYPKLCPLRTMLLAGLTGGGLKAFQTAFKPTFKLHNKPCNVLAQFGQFVLNAKRHFVKDLSAYQSVLFQFPQGLGEHLLGHAFDPSVEIPKPHAIL